MFYLFLEVFGILDLIRSYYEVSLALSTGPPKELIPQ